MPKGEVGLHNHCTQPARTHTVLLLCSIGADSFKWYQAILSGSRYFEILAKALSCRAVLRHQALMWSLIIKRLSMITPRALTDFSDLSVVFSSNFNSMSSAKFGDNIIDWNFSGFAFIPLLLNNSTAILQSISKFDKTVCRVDDEWELSSA